MDKMNFMYMQVKNPRYKKNQNEYKHLENNISIEIETERRETEENPHSPPKRKAANCKRVAEDHKPI